MTVMKRCIVGTAALILVLLFTSKNMDAQTNNKALQDAFKSSYSWEYKGNYADAIASLKGVFDENSYEINVRLGWLHYLSGSFTEATAYYQKAMTLMPYSIEAKFGYVLPASALGNWEQVKSRYDEILQIDPQNTLASYRMGMIYYGKQEYAKAEKYFEKVVNLYPFDYDSNIMFAWTNLKLGRYREAQVLFNKVLMLRPDDQSALEGLGLIK
jgi:tetratricopeptide (TPR) repeat protein